VVAGREDVGEHGQVEDLLQRLVAVGEPEQVPVGVRDQHVLGLAADPAAHVHVPVGRSRPVGVDLQADAGLAFLAVAAPAAGDVERYGADVPDLDELDIGPDVDHLTGDLVSEHQTLGGGGPPTHHVLVAAADVAGDCLEDRSVRGTPADVLLVDAGPVPHLVRRVVDVLDLDLAGALIDHRAIGWHRCLPSSWRRGGTLAVGNREASKCYAAMRPMFQRQRRKQNHRC
jgi:hypothetical protein